ncbi:hypothetical protein DYB26_007778 [Aphanomyces astaci]|nr:hypothetical protein DYB38_006814 [Aphanomyces astaci]RHZ42580.1 hypothetical protein DYB26_007778 [Aphanomyces astaci]
MMPSKFRFDNQVAIVTGAGAGLAIQAFGRVDIVVNNAGILRDRAFHKMSRSEWDAVKSVHLDGTAAKAGMVGFTKALAKEGVRSNIKVNAVAPGAGSSMTATILPEEVVKQWKPEYVAPTIAFLCHESAPCTGAVFECGGGWTAQVQFTRSEGYFFDLEKPISIDAVADHWKDITDFANATNPELDEMTPQLKQIMSKI